MDDLGKVKDSDLVVELQKRGFTSVKKRLRSGQSFRVDLKRWDGKSYRFGVVGCTHLGSRYQQLTALNQFYSLCARREISLILHCGDLLDGENMYRGHEYEIFAHGADRQLEYAVRNYPRRDGIETKVISGNHDLSFQKNAGYEIVKHIAEARDDIEYLGAWMAFLNISNIKIMLAHGSGGVAYARSYKLQKLVEQLAPENKPNFLFIAHWHIPCILPGYRNVESVSIPCFQYQTPYMAGKGLYPFIAGLIVTIQPDKKGLASVEYQWVPFYETIREDY